MTFGEDGPMKRRPVESWKILALLVVLIFPNGLAAQQDKVAALSQSLEKGAVTLEATFARLRDGLSHPGNVVLSRPEQKIQVVIQNSNYHPVAPAAPAPAQQSAAAAAKPAAASTAALDNLLAPIALYPDALIAQILEASKDFAAVQKFAAWLKSNSSLTGSALQDAAHKAGFATCYIALAPFPQVVQMLVEKPDWTKQLGAAFTSDQAAVYQSVQRLRAAAMALGNLKTTPQQEVVTETASTGQTVILVQPANPQVVYVPVYNTEVVYVQQAPPPSSSSSNAAAAAVIGFTAGIIIGSSSNNYYYGPYAWRGGAAAYHHAYERREDYVENRLDYAEDRRENAQDNAEDRRDNAQDNAEDRRDNAQGNQGQRQQAAQNNQAQRQSAAQTNQAARQSTAQTNQSTRQTTASTGSGGSGGTAQANQANRQSTAQANQSGRQAAAQSGAGYQGGASARSQSERGSASRGGGGGGGRR